MEERQEKDQWFQLDKGILAPTRKPIWAVSNPDWEDHPEVADLYSSDEIGEHGDLLAGHVFYGKEPASTGNPWWVFALGDPGQYCYIVVHGWPAYFEFLRYVAPILSIPRRSAE